MEINNNIEETRVSLEVAKLLKEFGFDVFCPKQYVAQCIWQGDKRHYKNSEIHSNSYFAPTQQLAIDWIRVNFNVVIYAAMDLCGGGSEDRRYFWGIQKSNNSRIDNDFESRHGYYRIEEAKEAAIIYCLTNLIK